MSLNCRLPHFIWSVEYNLDDILIKYNYDKSFAKFIKTLNVRWNERFEGWIGHKNHENKIIELILKAFPEWIFIDKRFN